MCRKYYLVNNTEYFYCTCLYPPSLVAVDTVYIFGVSPKYVLLVTCRRLLASSIVFFHGTFSVGCRYLRWPTLYRA
jgi:hypothetical protein